MPERECERAICPVCRGHNFQHETRPTFVAVQGDWPGTLLLERKAKDTCPKPERQSGLGSNTAQNDELRWLRTTLF